MNEISQNSSSVCWDVCQFVYARILQQHPLIILCEVIALIFLVKIAISSLMILGFVGIVSVTTYFAGWKVGVIVGATLLAAPTIYKIINHYRSKHLEHKTDSDLTKN